MSAGRLVKKGTDEDVPIGTKLISGDGIEYTLQGWRVPHKISSTGRVFVTRPDDEFEMSFFPTVFDLEIIDTEFSRR